MTDLKEIKEDIIDYINRELEHLEDKISKQFLSSEKIVENIEITTKDLDKRIYNDAQLRQIAFQESSSAHKKFWTNFKWFIGIVIIIVSTLFTIGIITWADVRDYKEYKLIVNKHIEDSVLRLNNIEKYQLNDTFKEEIIYMRELLKNLQQNKENK